MNLEKPSIAALKLAVLVGVPSLAFALYWWSVKKADEEEESKLSDQYDHVVKSRQAIIECKVPCGCVKTIIGTQGSTIKEIQAKTNTRISCKDRTNENVTGETVFLIRGAKLDVQRAELEIKRLVADTPVALTKNFYVPEFACGKIIGRGGEIIREITNKSRARIKLHNGTERLYKKSGIENSEIAFISSEFTGPDNYSFRVITLNGSVEQIAHAKELIVEKIREAESRLNRSKESKEPNVTKRVFIKSESNSSTMSDRLGSDEVKLSQPVAQTAQEVNESKVFLEQEEEVARLLANPPANPLLQNLEDCVDKDNQAEIYVTAVSDLPFNFWIQTVPNHKRVKLQDKEINDLYNSELGNAYRFAGINQVKIDSMVAANVTNDWHRAEVKGIVNNKDGTVIDIYFVDYGDSAFVSINKIRVLDQKFYSMPLQAIQCQLYNIEFAESDDETLSQKEKEQRTEEVWQFFEEKICWYDFKKLKLVIKGFAESERFRKPCVLLYNPQGESVSEKLVERKYAQYVNNNQVDNL